MARLHDRGQPKLALEQELGYGVLEICQWLAGRTARQRGGCRHTQATLFSLYRGTVNLRGIGTQCSLPLPGHWGGSTLAFRLMTQLRSRSLFEGSLNMDSLPSLYLWKVRPFSSTNSYILELKDALDVVLVPTMFSKKS
jgi:hypothetical protein